MTSPITIVDQLLPIYSPYDAIGNEATTLQKLLHELGFSSEIYIQVPSPFSRGRSQSYKKLFRQTNHVARALIYHFSTGSKLLYYLADAPFFRIGLYHNITPPQFFSLETDKDHYNACRDGRAQIPLGRFSFDAMWADSAFNARDLAAHEYPPTTVLPIVKDYAAMTRVAPDQTVLGQKQFARPTVLTVGRIAPNKAIHDVILLVHLYRQITGTPVRVVCAGRPQGEGYEDQLLRLCADLNLNIARPQEAIAAEHDVVFTGSISDEALAGYYRSADVFVSLSDHEGFCIPLIEAMEFGLPVITHSATALGETAGSGAIVIDKQQPREFIAALNALLTEPDFNQQARALASDRAGVFAWEKLKAQFKLVLQATLPRGRISGSSS